MGETVWPAPVRLEHIANHSRTNHHQAASMTIWVSIPIAIVVLMVVAPRPVLLLLFRRKLAKVAGRIAVILGRPLVIVGDLIVVPHVIVSVVRIVDAIVVVPFAIQGGRCQSQRPGQKYRSYVLHFSPVEPLVAWMSLLRCPAAASTIAYKRQLRRLRVG
jgi:hypothetical protein